jgi:regulator of RNase E activity RraA
MSNSNILVSQILCNKGNILSSDNKKCLLNEPAAVEAVQYWVNLFRKYNVAPKSSLENDNTVVMELFYNEKVAGPALTVLGTSEPLKDDELKKSEFDGFVIFDLIYKDCVIVINAEKDDQVGHWGEMMSYGSRNKKAAGVVIDGGTRDKAGILKIDNWVCFAKYTSPVESNKRWRYKAFEIPICMTGTLSKYVRVNPGDWIFGEFP